MNAMRRWAAALIGIALVTAACSGDESRSSGDVRTIVEFAGSQPGDVIALRVSDVDPTVVEWVDRRAGTISAVDVDAPDEIAVLASIEVGTDGEQRGLLGHTVIGGVRYAAWTDPDTEHLLVGALASSEVEVPASVDRVVWDAGGTAGGAVGGHLDVTSDGRLLLGIGQLTDWATAHGSGALLAIDPDGPADQEPTVVSDGYINPFAFEVVDDLVWVADNAVGDDTERTGPIELSELSESPESTDRADLDATGGDPRAPSAVVALADECTSGRSWWRSGRPLVPAGKTCRGCWALGARSAAAPRSSCSG
jgi:hypothetical protein